MAIKVTKESVRALVGLKRLPSTFRMYVIGAWLYDVLKANGLHEKYRLWNPCYWVRFRSLDTRHLALTWKVGK
jgi:hypothetical protein